MRPCNCLSCEMIHVNPIPTSGRPCMPWGSLPHETFVLNPSKGPRPSTLSLCQLPPNKVPTLLCKFVSHASVLHGSLGTDQGNYWLLLANLLHWLSNARLCKTTDLVMELRVAWEKFDIQLRASHTSNFILYRRMQAFLCFYRIPNIYKGANSAVDWMADVYILD